MQPNLKTKHSILFYKAYLPLTLVAFAISCQQSSSYMDKEKALQQAAYNQYTDLLKPSSEIRDFATSVRLLDSAYHSTKSHNEYAVYSYNQISCWMNISLQHYEQAIHHADSAIDVIEKLDSRHLLRASLPEIYMLKGEAYVGLINYPKAYDCYFKGKLLAESSTDDCLKASIERNIAMVLYKQQQFALAKNSFIEEVEFMKKCAIKEPYFESNGLQQEYDNIALCYTKIKQYDSARYYYQLALNNIEKYKYTASNDSFTSLRRYATCKGVIYGNLAKILFANNQLDSAETLYKKAIELNTIIGLEHADAQLCQAQLLEVQSKKNDWSAVLQTLNELKKSLDTLPNPTAQLSWYQYMAAYHSYNNNPIQELPYFKHFIAIRDSLDAVKKVSQETIITKELKDKESELKISLLEKDKQLSSLIIWIVAAISLLTIAIAILIFNNYKKSKKTVQVLTNLNQQINEQKVQLEFAMTALEKSNKDKDRILRVVAHDLRNPIGGIAALTQSMIDDSVADEQHYQLLQMIESTATNSLHLINELLQANNNQVEQLNKQLIDINQLLKQSVFMLQFKANEKQQTIETSLADDPVFISANAEKMERVINNLIGNAIKFSPTKSVIKVQVQHQQNKVLILVEDKGIGIAPEQVPHVFDMFTTAKRQGTAGEQSFGLGLSICQQIVEAHGGKIWVESEEGKGSSFFVELPLL